MISLRLERVERTDFQLAPGIFLEFYRFPDGEKRVGRTSASVVCGHRKEYLTRLSQVAPKQWEALRPLGFNGCTRSGLVERQSVGGKGSARVETISLEDFRIFVEFSAFDVDKKPAKSIARGMLGVAIETIAKQAFGEEALTLAEIRSIICKEYAKTIDWLEEDREDARAIDEHLLFVRTH